MLLGFLAPASATQSDNGPNHQYSSHLFHTTQDVQDVAAEWLDDHEAMLDCTKNMRRTALRAAANTYAKFLIKGEYVPDTAMKVMRNARDTLMFNAEISERTAVKQIIIQQLQKLSNDDYVNVPNKMPRFLSDIVTDITPMAHNAIDQMNLNPHIAEHMKHSVRHYYTDRGHLADGTALSSHIRSKLSTMASKYKLLDDAITEGGNLQDIDYIVIPDVGATAEAITNRTAPLDTLFAANSHLTLVVAFADDVTTVGQYFCTELAEHVEKLSFTGKNLYNVGNGFFTNAQSLTSVDFRGLAKLEKIGDFFFMGATSLTSLNLRGLSALHTVGEGFFMQALALKSLNLRGLSALHTVGKCFFKEAIALKSLGLRGLSALHTVGDCFFMQAIALTSVDLSGLRALTTLQSGFLGGTIKLQSIYVLDSSQEALVKSVYHGHVDILILPPEGRHANNPTVSIDDQSAATTES